MKDKFAIRYDLKKPQYQTISSAKFKQGNVNTSELEVTIYEDGLKANITGETIEFRFLKPDGMEVFQDFAHGVTITDAMNGIVNCVLMTETLQAAGLCKCEVYRKLGDKELTMPSFTFVIEKSLGQGSLSQNYIGAVESKIIEWGNQVTAYLDLDWTGPQGLKGGKGDKGDTGAQGLQGIPGELHGQEQLDKIKILNMNLATEVTLKRDKSVLIPLADFAQDAKEAMTGGSVAVVGVDAVLEENILDNQVSAKKTNFIKINKNLFNKDASTEGGHYTVAGQFAVEANYWYSDLMPVTEGLTYKFSRKSATTGSRSATTISFITGYKNGTVVNITDTLGRNKQSITIPTGIDAIRISSVLSQLTDDAFLMVEEGNAITEYEPYQYKINYFDIKNDRIADKEIEPNKLNVVNKLLPSFLKFKNGGLEYNSTTKAIVFKAFYYSSNTELLEFKKGDKIIKLNNIDTYFNLWEIEIIDNIEYKVSTVSHSTANYTVLNDGYYRVTQAYTVLKDILTSDLKLFNDEMYISYSSNNSVVLKGDLLQTDPSNPKREIILPPSIPCVIGKQIHIYMDNILRYGNYYTSERFEVSGKGDIISGGFEYAPISSSIEETLTFNYYQSGNIVNTSATIIKPVLADSGNGVTKKVLLIGESTSDNESFRGELYNLFNTDVMNVEFLGTRGTAPAINEARAGWSIENFLHDEIASTFENAFYNPNTLGFDFTYYMAQQGYTGVDYVIIDLGLNDTGRNASDIIADYNTMIDNIHAYDPNIKIFVGLTNLPARWENLSQKYLKDKVLSTTKELINEFGNREGEGFFLIPIYTNLDPFWDMQYTETAISNRNSKTTFIGTNTVHPSLTGYYKSADVHYHVIKYVASL